MAEGDGTTSGNEMNIKLDLFNVTGIKAIKIFYNSFFGLYCLIYLFSWKINIGSFKVVFNLVKGRSLKTQPKISYLQVYII